MLAFVILFLSGVGLCINRHPIWGGLTIFASLLALLAMF
jgi:hypothetical protein